MTTRLKEREARIAAGNAVKRRSWNYPKGQAPVSANPGQPKKKPKPKPWDGMPSLDHRLPIRLQLPWPPSVNAYWEDSVQYSAKLKKYVVHKRVGDRGKNFRHQVGVQCLAAHVASSWLEGPLEFELWAHPPKNFRYDLDNLRKALWDSLGAEGAGVYRDDSQIEHDKGWKMPKDETGEGYVVIEIRRFANPHSAHNQMDLLNA